jgi:RNA polymerase-interacting CarD/CdnL/TRCF family regulator
MNTNSREFATGSEVIYGLHGRCAITSVETKSAGGATQEFYRLEPLIKNPIVKTVTKKDTAILIPVSGAKARGLRNPMSSSQDVESIYAILDSREYYWPLETSWREIQPQLEKSIYHEGATNLTKTLNYLHILKAQHVVPPSDIVKLHEHVAKLLAREISEVTTQTVSQVEADLDRRLKSKSRPDT